MILLSTCHRRPPRRAWLTPCFSVLNDERFSDDGRKEVEGSSRGGGGHRRSGVLNKPGAAGRGVSGHAMGISGSHWAGAELVGSCKPRVGVGAETMPDVRRARWHAISWWKPGAATLLRERCPASTERLDKSFDGKGHAAGSCARGGARLIGCGRGQWSTTPPHWGQSATSRPLSSRSCSRKLCSVSVARLLPEHPDTAPIFSLAAWRSSAAAPAYSP